MPEMAPLKVAELFLLLRKTDRGKITAKKADWKRCHG